jgi:hypothetical protein
MLLALLLAAAPVGLLGLRLAIHPGERVSERGRVVREVARAAEIRGWAMDPIGPPPDVILVVDDDRCGLPEIPLSKWGPPSTPLVISRVLSLNPSADSARPRREDGRLHAIAYRYRVTHYTRGIKTVHMLLPVLESHASAEYVHKVLDFVESVATL